MTGKEDEALDKALSELLIQAEKEPISPRLRELTRKLEAALAAARDRQKTEEERAR